MLYILHTHYTHTHTIDFVFCILLFTASKRRREDDDGRFCFGNNGCLFERWWLCLHSDATTISAPPHLNVFSVVCLNYLFICFFYAKKCVRHRIRWQAEELTVNLSFFASIHCDFCCCCICICSEVNYTMARFKWRANLVATATHFHFKYFSFTICCCCCCSRHSFHSLVLVFLLQFCRNNNYILF